MTCGIYKLNFNGTDKVYIGKSITIESRYSSHKYYLKKGEHSKKLQEAYNLYGMPTISIIKECLPEELNFEEIYSINQYNSIDQGFNTAKGGQDTGNLYGYDNYNILYDKKVYGTILDMLVSTKYTTKEISEYLGVKVNIVRDICSLTSHSWLKEEFPANYTKLLAINNISRNSYLSSNNRATKVVSPEGIVLEVESIKLFAEKYGLLNSGLSKLLHGDILSHKGWTLEGTKLVTHYPEVLSPEGIMYSIRVGKAKEFALSHGLTQSSFQRLLTGKTDSHKGWKLASKIIDLREALV